MKKLAWACTALGMALAACTQSTVVTPPGGGGGTSSPTPAPSTRPTATPVPVSSPAPTPEPVEHNLVVDSGANAMVVGPMVGLPPVPFTTDAIEKNAFDDRARNLPFHAVAGVHFDTYGWRYARVETVQEARDWYGSHGSGGEVCFLDSTDGLLDNAGTWRFVAHSTTYGTHTTVVDATEHVTAWDPARAVSVDLGATHTWTVWTERVRDRPHENYPLPGVFLVYRRPDGSRDFVVVRREAQTIEAQGYVYAFYLVKEGGYPGQSDRVVLVPR